MYSKRTDKIWKLLNLIATSRTGEMYQGEMAKKLDCSYRNLIRQLQTLKAVNLIRLARTEPSLKKGKEKHIWALTFSGMIAAFVHALRPFGSLPEDAETIAHVHKDSWLIFHEWSYLTKDQEIKELILNGISNYAYKSLVLRKDFRYLAREVELVTEKDLKQSQQVIQLWREKTLRKEITIAALWLDMILEEAAVPPWINEHHNIGTLWKLAASNQNIRKFVESAFKHEHFKHKMISLFQSWLLDGKVFDWESAKLVNQA